MVWAVIFFNLVSVFFEIKEFIQERKSKKLPKKNPYLRVVDEHPGNERKDFLVYEMYNKNADFKTLFDSLGSDLKSLAFESRDQIKTFCKENRQWLRTDGYGAFFLFTEKVDDKEEFFVASVRLGSAELKVYVDLLSYDFVWACEQCSSPCGTCYKNLGYSELDS